MPSTDSFPVDKVNVAGDYYIRRCVTLSNGDILFTGNKLGSYNPNSKDPKEKEKPSLPYVLKIDKTSGIVTIYAGNGKVGKDDGPAAEASFNDPGGLAVLSDDCVVVADYRYR